MKILLFTVPLNPKCFEFNAFAMQEPLALEYLGAGVNEKHEVKILDLRIEPETVFKNTLESFKPDIVGCGATTIEVYNARRLLAEAKKTLPGVLTVVGGIHATVKPDDFFEDPIDVVVIGEGVHPFKKICDSHEKQKSFKNIENIYYREDKNGKMAFTGKEPYPDLDTLPFPDRALTSRYRKRYLGHLVGTRNMALIRGSNGCIYRCKFCVITNFLEHKIYTRNIDTIIKELESIEAPFIFWIDDELFLDPARAITLAKAVDKAGIKKDFVACARVDTIVNHPECVEEWAKVGLRYLMVGFESHKEQDLKKMRKGNILAKNEEAIRICSENLIKIRGGFILMQDYDRADFKSLARYVRHLDIDTPVFSVYTPLPGSVSYQEEKDNLITDDYNFFDMTHTVLPTKLPLKQFYKEYIHLVSRVTTLKKKINTFRKLDPKIRKQFYTIFKQLLNRLKNAYRDYDESLW